MQSPNSTGQPRPPPPLPLQKPLCYRGSTTPTHRRPPRKPVNLPPSFYRNKRRCSSCQAFRCCFFTVIALLIMVFVLAGGFFYFWFQPRLPGIHLESIKFTKSNVSTTPDGPVLDAESSIGVEIRKPNQNLRIDYGRSRAFLNADNGDVNLGELTLPGFIEDMKNVTNLKLATKVEEEIVNINSAEELQ